MRKILQLALAAPLAILLFAAFAGALVALFGGVAGLESVKVVGGTVSGLGALGFFALLLSPLGEIVASLSTINSRSPNQSKVNAPAQRQAESDQRPVVS